MCRLCGKRSTEFVKLNNTDQYSDIEISVSNAGLLRARNFRGAINNTNSSSSQNFNQDVVNINFCPMCGRNFKQIQTSNINY